MPVVRREYFCEETRRTGKSFAGRFAHVTGHAEVGKQEMDTSGKVGIATPIHTRSANAKRDSELRTATVVYVNAYGQQPRRHAAM